MDKTLLHSGTFLTHDGRAIRVSFYKRGYSLVFKPGQDVVHNFTNEGGTLDLRDIFEYNGTLDVKTGGRFEYDDQWEITIPFNLDYTARDIRIVVFLKEDPEMKAVIRVHQDATELTYDWTPANLEFSGYQEFRPLAITAKMERAGGSWDDPVLYGFEDTEEEPVQHINWFIMDEFRDNPMPVTREELPDGGYHSTWWVGCYANASGDTVRGEATIGLEAAGGYAEYVPVSVRSKSKIMEASIDMDEHSQFSPTPTVDAASHRGYIGWSFDGDEFTEDPTVDIELVDIGWGTDWIHLDARGEEDTDPFNYFDVEAIHDETDRRAVIIRVFNTENREMKAECMIIQQ